MKQILIFFVLAASVLGISRRTPKYEPISPFIANGRDATYGEFPFQVSIQDSSFGYDNPICGGAIYNENYVLTSATCLYGKSLDDPSYLKIYAGDNVMSDTDGNEQKIKVTEVTLHEDYNVYTHINDIALLKLKEPIDLSGPYAQAIALASEGQAFTGDCTLTGWGRTQAGMNANTLQVATLSLITDDACRDVYGIPDIDDSMICAGDGSQGMCEGDIGAPLACVDGGQTYLTGLAHYTNGCGLSGYPTVSTELSAFIKWVTNNAN